MGGRGQSVSTEHREGPDHPHVCGEKVPGFSLRRENPRVWTEHRAGPTPIDTINVAHHWDQMRSCSCSRIRSCRSNGQLQTLASSATTRTPTRSSPMGPFGPIRHCVLAAHQTCHAATFCGNTTGGTGSGRITPGSMVTPKAAQSARNCSDPNRSPLLQQTSSRSFPPCALPRLDKTTQRHQRWP